MSITGPGSITAATVATQNNLMNQLNTLGQELSSGQAATTYSGLESQAGTALALSAQLSAINGYSSTATTVGTTLSAAQTALSALGSASSAVQQAITQESDFSLNSNGQTATQVTATDELDQIFAVLNTQVGSNYIFSGSATTQPSVAPTDEILNGTATQAGFTQIMQQRLEADEGVGNMGRLSVAVGGVGSATVTLSQDGSPFGFQLANVSSSLTGATVTQTSTPTPSIAVALGASPPNVGNTISFDLTLPDGSSQTITLTGTDASPPGTDQFTIDPTSSANTATNMQTALNSAISNLAQTALPAASAMAAANNFFESDPPQIVNATGSPPDYATAMSLTNGTTANTVFWYTGEDGSTPARQTATAQIGPSMTIDYGMRANEQALSTLVANVAVLATTTYSPSDSNAETNYQALTQDVGANLAGQSGTQSISDIEADIGNAQSTVSDATSLNTQTQSTLTNMLQGIEGVNENQIGEDILTLQNNLSASMSITARLAQLSLVNYLSAVSG